MPEVLVALGSNVGDPRANLQAAVDELRKRFEVQRVSRLYRTAPMYVEDQPEFLNGAVLLQTGKAPLQVLQALKVIEGEIGRHKERRYGPREIDLDLLSYGRLQYRFSEGRTILVVPHPRIPERRFVLAPLADIAPDLMLPGLGRVSHLLGQTNGQAESVHEVEDAIL